MPETSRKTQHAIEATKSDGKRVNFGPAAASLEELEEEIKTWPPSSGAKIVERVTTTTTTDWKPVGYAAPADSITFAKQGSAKVMWPDGTEVSAEQFNNSVTIANEAYAIGQADALKKAMAALRKRHKHFSEAGAGGDYLNALNDAWGLLNNQLRDTGREDL